VAEVEQKKQVQPRGENIHCFWHYGGNLGSSGYFVTGGPMAQQLSDDVQFIVGQLDG